MTTIAILGWGSLLWDRKPEFGKWHDDWRADGPLLKLEFSRMSATRLGTLTLAVDGRPRRPDCRRSRHQQAARVE
jgi:hypothetical protein